MNYVDYDVVRDGNVIFEGYATADITDKNVNEVAEFIRDNHFSGELVDVPSHVYDRIVNAIVLRNNMFIFASIIIISRL